MKKILLSCITLLSILVHIFASVYASDGSNYTIFSVGTMVGDESFYAVVNSTNGSIFSGYDSASASTQRYLNNRTRMYGSAAVTMYYSSSSGTISATQSSGMVDMDPSQPIYTLDAGASVSANTYSALTATSTHVGQGAETVTKSLSVGF